MTPAVRGDVSRADGGSGPLRLPRLASCGRRTTRGRPRRRAAERRSGRVPVEAHGAWLRDSRLRADARRDDERAAWWRTWASTSASPGAAQRSEAHEHGDRRPPRAAGDPRADAGAAPQRRRRSSTSTRRAYIAARIPRRELVELPGEDHALRGPTRSRSRAEIEEFLSGSGSAASGTSSSPTACSRPCCSRTSSARRRGGRARRPALARSCSSSHHALVRRQLVRFRGRELDNAGDGFFASFDGPARAIRCACAIAEAVESWASTSAPACTPASASSSRARSAGSPSTSARGSPPRPSPERCSSRARSRISSPARASGSASAASPA